MWRHFLQTWCAQCVHTCVFCVFYREIRENKSVHRVEKRDPFWTIFDKFWQILTNFDKFWQILSKFLTIFDNFWQFLTNFWQILTKNRGLKQLNLRLHRKMHPRYTRCTPGVHTVHTHGSPGSMWMCFTRFKHFSPGTPRTPTT